MLMIGCVYIVVQATLMFYFSQLQCMNKHRQARTKYLALPLTFCLLTPTRIRQTSKSLPSLAVTGSYFLPNRLRLLLIMRLRIEDPYHNVRTM